LTSIGLKAVPYPPYDIAIQLPVSVGRGISGRSLSLNMKCTLFQLAQDSQRSA
jgi:hypothetical protein